jgi:ferredoxin
MIVTEQKQFDEIKQNLKSGEMLFLIGCGECSTTCKTGGEEEVKALIRKLEEHGFFVTGYTVPKAPCVASGLRIELAKHRREIEEADSVLVLACGLGVQSVVENLRELKPVHVGCNTLFMGAVDQSGTNFFQYCSACGDCLLEYTGGICPITRCSKGILNGPCGGVDRGKCEVDKERDCAWVLIYERLKKLGRLDLLERIYPPKDYSKVTKPLSRSIS